MSDDGDFSVRARDLAEAVLEAYAQQASAPAQPMSEQTLVTRLVEGFEAAGASASGADLAAAANAVLDGHEGREPEARGPRIATLDPRTGAVTLRPA